MTSVKTVIYAFCLILFLTSCASLSKYSSVENTLPQIKPGYGRIVFYRNKYFPNMQLPMPLTLSGEKFVYVGQTQNGTCFIVDRPAGKYTMALESPLLLIGMTADHSLSFILDDGQTRYVRTTFQAMAYHQYSSELVNQDEAEREIQDLDFMSEEQRQERVSWFYNKLKSKFVEQSAIDAGIEKAKIEPNVAK